MTNIVKKVKQKDEDEKKNSLEVSIYTNNNDNNILLTKLIMSFKEEWLRIIKINIKFKHRQILILINTN